MNEEKPPLKLYKKLWEIQNEVDYLKKNAKGHNFKYASPEAVLGVIRPLMNAKKILLMQEVLEQKIISYEKNKKHYNLVDLKLKMTWIDIETGEQLPCLWVGLGENGDEKGEGSALTYAERYFLLKFFHIPTGEDDPDYRKPKNKQPQYTQKKEPQELTFEQNYNMLIKFANELKLSDSDKIHLVEITGLHDTRQLTPENLEAGIKFFRGLKQNVNILYQQIITILNVRENDMPVFNVKEKTAYVEKANAIKNKKADLQNLCDTLQDVSLDRIQTIKTGV